jgi:hypothetical protein
MKWIDHHDPILEIMNDQDEVCVGVCVGGGVTLLCV